MSIFNHCSVQLRWAGLDRDRIGCVPCANKSAECMYVYVPQATKWLKKRPRL